MNVIETFVQSPVKVSVGVLLVVLFGVISIVQLPRQLTPDVEIPTITIETRWPGASPQEVEREIVQEQEEQLKSVEGVQKMTSQSFDSLANITLEFNVGVDMEAALLRVNTRLQQVREYPVDADEPVLTTTNLSNNPIAWFILTPRPPTEEQIRQFAARHPPLAALVARAAEAHNPALRVFRIREAVAQHPEHPELAELLPPDIDVPKLRRFAEDVIEMRFERVSGVSAANVLGGEEEEMQLIVDPQKLAARQLTVGDVREALRAQNLDTSSGEVWEGKRRWAVRTLGQFRSPEQVAAVILARRDGAPVYVRDVAEVQLGFKRPDGLTRRFGVSNLAVNCQRETGANVLATMEGLRAALDELNRGVLAQRGLYLEQVYDETEYIDSAIGVVWDNILVGSALTFLTLLLFLRSGRSTVIIGVHIVISTVGAFIVMLLLGRSLNVLCLGGLAFAVGMLVDNAIVMLENIYRRFEQGEAANTAAVRGAKEVWGALLNASVVNLAVFLPVLFSESEVGQLFRDIALAISASVGLSLLVAVAVVPTAAVRMLRGEKPRPRGARLGVASNGSPHAPDPNGPTPVHAHSRWGRAVQGLFDRWLHPLDVFGAWFVSLVVGVNAWLQRSVRWQLLFVGLTVGGSCLAAWLMLPRTEYLPLGNRNLVLCMLLPPPGYNIEQLTRIGEDLERLLRPYWDLDADGPEAGRLEHPAIADFFYVARGRMLFMGLRAADPLQAGRLVPLIQQATRNIPGTLAVAKQSSLFERGLGAGRTVDIEITGPDIRELVALGGRILGQVNQVIPGAQAIPQPSLDLSSPEIHVVPKWEQAADMHVSATDLGYTVDALVDGAYAGDYFTGGDKIDLTIKGQQRFATRTQDLEELPVATPTGELVPLAAVADVRLASGPEQINHRERQRAITIQVTPPPEVPLEDAMLSIQSQIVQPILEGHQIGPEYRIGLSGTADKLRLAWESMRWSLLLALVITYLLMAALFESWLFPLVIIASVPLGAVGGFAGLWLINRFVLQPLDVLTMLGFVILVGTVVNNPILIVEQAIIHMRDEGLPQRQAILESVRSRIRPIFMTTLGGLIGLLPLVISPGAGSELYRGLGAVLLGGLLLSTVLTLVLVPTLFSLTLEAKQRTYRWLGWKDAWADPEAPPSAHGEAPHKRAPAQPVG
jgi:HAE1 family hydrophobic/amphiphilic exporter-1